jgi:Tol biopolymer transport system component
LKRLAALFITASLIATGFSLWAHQSSTADVTADGVPAAPTAVRTFPVLGGLGLLWSPPTETGGQVESYLVQVQRSNETWANASNELPADTSSWVDTRLHAGDNASYRIIAVNADGQSTPSTVAAGTRPETDPVIGDGDLLLIDADLGGAPTWLRDELAAPVTQAAADDTRTLSAGTARLTLPTVFPGPGAYPVGSGKQPFVVRQGERDCALDGTLTIAELAYTADLQVATLAARYSGSCDGAASVHGEIRVKSTKPYAALSIDPPRVDLGRIWVGAEPKRAAATIKNIGQIDLSLSIQPLAGTDPRWFLRDRDSCVRLAPGESCTVQMEFNANYATDYVKTVEFYDNTARSHHHIQFAASAFTVPTMPKNVRVASTYNGVDLSWQAPSWSNAKPVGFVVQRSVGGIDTKFSLPPDQFTWTEPFPDGQSGADYKVWAVNEAGEGQPSAVVSAYPARQQVAVFSGRPGQPDTLGGFALPYGRQIVPAAKAPAGERAELTSSPNGVDLAYTLADGENTGLWIRRTEGGTPTDTLLRSAAGVGRPAWSPDGTRIAFTVAGADSATCVDVISLADRSVVRVGCSLDFPTWHPDGRTLIVQDNRLTGSPLARVEARDQGPRISTLAGSAGATHATVSPDGQWLAYLPAAKPNQIGFLPIAGGTSKVTDFSAGTAEAISWDPVGERLAVLIRWQDQTHVDHVDMRDVVNGYFPIQWATVYGATSEHVADIAWQGRKVVIKTTPASSGPAVSIPFDTSALNGERAQCWLDDTNKGDCTSPFTATGLTTGSHKFQVRTVWSSGTPGLFYSAWSTRTFTVDATGPVSRVVSPTTDTTTAGSVAVKYSASDSTGAVSYDVRYRKASYLSGFGAYIQPWTATTATSVNLTLDPGYEYCVSVRARDKLANIGAWSPEKCFARPMDDRALAAPTAGWTRPSWSAFYLNTATQTASYGASLTRTVQGKRFYLVATKCPTCGLVAAYAGGKYIGAVNLAASTTQRQAVIPLPVQSTIFSGTLTFTVRSATGKGVQIDGLAVRRT